MQQPNWKERLERLPVLGNLLTGLKGIYTLRTWRAQMRDDIARLEQLVRSLEQLMQAQDEILARAQADMREHGARLGDGFALLEWRFNRLHSELKHAQRGLSQLAWDLGRQAVPDHALAVEPVSPAAGDAAVLPQPRTMDASELAQQMAPFRRALEPLPPEEDVLHLHAYPVDAWLTVLQRERGRYRLITALENTDDERMPLVGTLARHAVVALQPQGCFVLSAPNPENLVVASALMQHEERIPVVLPQRARSAVLAAGFDEVEVVRFDADDIAPLPGDGRAIERLNEMLCWPRRYALIARKA